MRVNDKELAMVKAPVREIRASVLVKDENGVESGFYRDENLKSFSIERVGNESKFFGFGICQKINVHVIDMNRELDITTAHKLTPFMNAGFLSEDIYPDFWVTEVHRNEKTNELSITAYDALYKLGEHYFSEIQNDLFLPYTLEDIIGVICLIFGDGLLSNYEFIGLTEEVSPFDLSFPDGANLEGTETIREVLDAIAEATQTIYYLDGHNNLIFKRLDITGEPVYTITKDDYIELESKTNRRLCSVVSATQLGDNVGASLEQTGTTQYVRDNPFWELREDIDTLVENAVAAIGGLTINQFDCSWRGSTLLEPTDKIAIVTKDNDTVISYILNDVISYDGTLSQKTQWNYIEGEESESNPSTLGEVLRQTYARVDKQNKEISMVITDTTALKLDVNDITSTVRKTNNKVDDLYTQVTTKTSAEDVQILIESKIATDVNKVTTSTGYTFDNNGLKITKTDSELSTEITEDGMSIKKDSQKVLEVNNQGVKAEDLHATTYLIIGNNSRFEDYSGGRTGCFWIG